MAVATNARVGASHLHLGFWSRASVPDIGRATETLSHIAAQLEYQNDLERAYLRQGGHSGPIAHMTKETLIFTCFLAIVGHSPLPRARS